MLNQIERPNKRGQVAYFFIIGLVLLVLVLILFNFKSWIMVDLLKQQTREEVTFSQAVENVRHYVQSTIDNLAEEGVITLGRQGGLVNLKNGYVMTDYSNISSSLPEKEILNRELSNYISQNLKNALVFENNTFYTVETVDRVTVKTSFTENKIIIETIFPVTVKVGNGTERKLEPFKTVLDVRMNKIYDLAESIVKSPDIISYADSLEDMKLNIYKEGDVKVYVLTDKKSEVRGKNYRFLFTENIR